MRAAAIGAILALSPFARAAAQLALHLSVGARYNSSLVHDSIVTTLDVRPNVAPAFAVAITLPEHRGWAGEALLDVSWSGLRRHDGGGQKEDLGGLCALSFAVGLRRTLVPGLGARALVGGLRYLPARESGVFRAGAELMPLLGAGVDYTPPFAPGLSIELRADAHRFLTRALSDAGFTEHRLVPRVSLALRADVTRLW